MTDLFCVNMAIRGLLFLPLIVVSGFADLGEYYNKKTKFKKNYNHYDR